MAAASCLPLLLAALLLCCCLSAHGFNLFRHTTRGVSMTHSSRLKTMMYIDDKSSYADSVNDSRVISAKGENNIKSTTKRTMASALLFLTSPFAYIQSANAINSVDLAVISTARPVLDTFINVMSVFFLIRVVVSWYPKTDLKKLPYNIATWATEPILSPLREILPPAFGVDVSPIACIMILSFVREVLISQQGILSLLEKSAI